MTALLEERLATCQVVERAKGVLMRREGLSEEEVYLRIQRQARQERRTMRQVVERAQGVRTRHEGLSEEEAYLRIQR